MHKSSPSKKADNSARLNALGFVWGFAESTLFFIVPDVLISYVALSSFKKALKVIFWVTAGALLGGIIMFIWGYYNEPNAIAVVKNVPLVSDAMVQTTEQQLSEHGAMAILLGPIKMTPFKIYAVFASHRDVSLIAFVIVAIIARISRFIIVALIASGLMKLFSKWVSYKQARIILVVVWVTIYVQYFIHNS